MTEPERPIRCAWCGRTGWCECAPWDDEALALAEEHRREAWLPREVTAR